ncbi:hypothetical protein [Synechococcus sp. WH 5701]|uniref:hypothetical protein n=1 Tax=Synechococcus sp. WH 5701 TaxID=69042 RepID=UPI0000698F43|nr:hypothetical protein [Synechococcus sp. WH 5701]EAQ74120.1 hypothetical protein WH5701_12438 [Synechococcus sp. WH 5701]
MEPTEGMLCSVVVQFFEDFDFIEEVLRQFSWVDEILINDGPFAYAVELLGPVIGRDLGEPSRRARDVFSRLSAEMGVPIHYFYHQFEDEREKRLFGYGKARGEVVLSVDADELLLLNREMVEAFAASSALAASFNCYNFTYLNLLLISHPGAALSSPKPFAFRREAISPEEHINYLWLVGVEQQAASAEHFLAGTLCDGIHLTTIRSSYGASIKYGFYNCLYFKTAGKPLEGVYAEALNFFRQSLYPIELRTEVLARAMPDAIGFPMGHVLHRPQPGELPAAVASRQEDLSRAFNRNRVKRRISGSLLPSVPTYLLCEPGTDLQVALSVSGSARLKVVPLRLDAAPFSLEQGAAEHTWVGEALTVKELNLEAPDEEPSGDVVAYLLELTLWIAPEEKERFRASSLAPTFSLSVS